MLTQLARVEGLRDRFEECDRCSTKRRRWVGPRRACCSSAGGESARRGSREKVSRSSSRRSSGPDERRGRPRSRCGAHACDRRRQRSMDGARSRHRCGVRRSRCSLLARAALQQRGLVVSRSGRRGGRTRGVRLALASRERDDPRPYTREIARYAVGKALRALGRAGEAAAALEQCLAWAAAAGVEDGYFHEELAEDTPRSAVTPMRANRPAARSRSQPTMTTPRGGASARARGRLP